MYSEETLSGHDRNNNKNNTKEMEKRLIEIWQQHLRLSNVKQVAQLHKYNLSYLEKFFIFI